MDTRDGVIAAALIHAKTRANAALRTNDARERDATHTRRVRAKFVTRQIDEAIESLEIARDLIAKEV